MTSPITLVATTATIFFLSVSIFAQATGPELNHFDTHGLSFDYPSGYSITDQSTTEAQQLIITRKGSSFQLSIIAMRSRVMRDELSAAIENFKEPIVKKIAIALGEGKTPLERTSFQTEVGSRQAEGIRLQSKDGKVSCELVWLRLGFRLVGLAFIRSSNDDSDGSRLWETVKASLRIEGPVLDARKKGAKPNDNADNDPGVLNGKALVLPQPAYPPVARAAHVSGTVIVEVLIDEQGNVSTAHAVDGHVLLQPACVAAALKAKFSPTLLEGEPIKVAGVITYRFVL